MFCKNCGAQFEGAFCTNCGTAAEVAPVVAEEAPAVEYVAPEMTTPAEDPGKKQGQTSLILGIVSLVCGTVCSCVPYVSCLASPASLVTAIIALILGSKASKLSAEAGYENGKAKTGKLLGIISLVVYALYMIASVIIGFVYGFALVGSEFY